MCWFKRDTWKTGIAIAGMLLLLVLMVCVPVPAVGAYEVTPGLATPVTVMSLILLAGSERMHPFSSQRLSWSSAVSLAFGVGVWIDEMHKTKS